MMMVNLETVATVSASRALSWIAGGIAIALFAEILLRVARHQNSRTRFVVWFAALLGIAFLPGTGYLLLSQKAYAVSRMHPNLTLPVSWAIGVFLAWAVVASISLLRVGFGVLQIRKLRNRSIEIETSSLDPLIRKHLQEHAGRKIVVYQCDEVRVPIAVGFLRPAIILPSWTRQALSTSELNAVLLHEIAHIRRWDDWTNLVQKLLGALFFFHPAVWWIESRLALERELACDDVVVSENSDPRDYANCLVSLAEKSFSRRGVALAQAAVMRVRHIRRRISRILNTNRSARITVWKPALALVGCFSMLSFFASARIPQLVSFQDSPPTLQAAGPGLSMEVPAEERSSTINLNTHRQAKPLRANASIPSLQQVASNAQKLEVSQKRLLQAKSEQNLAPHKIEALPQLRAASLRSEPSQAYLLVIHANYSQGGEIVWSVGVVQLTVFHPRAAPTQPQSSQKT